MSCLLAVPAIDEGMSWTTVFRPSTTAIREWSEAREYVGCAHEQVTTRCEKTNHPDIVIKAGVQDKLRTPMEQMLRCSSEPVKTLEQS